MKELQLGVDTIKSTYSENGLDLYLHNPNIDMSGESKLSMDTGYDLIGTSWYFIGTSWNLS